MGSLILRLFVVVLLPGVTDSLLLTFCLSFMVSLHPVLVFSGDCLCAMGFLAWTFGATDSGDWFCLCPGCHSISKHVKAFLKHVRAICLLPSCFEQELDSGLDSDIWNMAFSGMLWRDRRMSLDPPWWRSPDKPCPICPTPPLKTPLRVWSSVNLKHYLPFQRHSKLDSLASLTEMETWEIWNRMRGGHILLWKSEHAPATLFWNDGSIWIIENIASSTPTSQSARVRCLRGDWVRRSGAHLATCLHQFASVCIILHHFALVCIILHPNSLSDFFRVFSCTSKDWHRLGGWSLCGCCREAGQEGSESKHFFERSFFKYKR